jgi:hypothetical protein
VETINATKEVSAMSTDIPGAGRIRTSDAEREQVAELLRAAVTEGRLSLEEGDQRLARTYAATYREELGPLTADLPSGGWEALARTPEALRAARRRLRRHGSFVAIAAGVLVGLWILSGAHFFWPFLPILFLTFGLVRHVRFVRYGSPWGWGRGPWGQGRRGPWGWR